MLQDGKMKNQHKKTVNAEFYKGKYYTQLLAIFMTIAALFFMFFISIAIFTFSQIQKNEKNSQQIFAQNRYSLVDTAIAVLLNSMDSFIRNPLLKEWADAQTQSDYYANAIPLLSHISLTSSQLGALSYEITVIGERYTTMTLSGSGSATRDWYFDYETMLSYEQIQLIDEQFSRQDSLLVIPTYSTNNILQELYFIRQQQWNTQKTLVIFKVLARPMFTPDSGESFCLIRADGERIYARNTIQAHSAIEQFFLVAKNTFFFDDADNRYFSDFLHTSPWRIVSVFEKNKSFQIIIGSFFILFSAFLLIFCRQTAKKIAYTLYYPLGILVIDSLSNFSHKKESKSKPSHFDEFEALKNNSQKISVLAHELQNTIDEKESLTRQNYFRNLLEGTKTEKNDTKPYYTALGLSTNNDKIPYVQFFVDAHALNDSKMQYVQYSHSSFVLILQCTTQDDAKERVKKLLRMLEKEGIDILVALSNAVYGEQNIYEAFNQSRSIAEYRHTVPNTTIITENMIKNDTATDFYTYPLEMEQKILALIVDGSSHTSEYFERIIQDNLHSKKISTQRLQNLIYALTGTLVRSLQELKTTSTELIGTSIDWSRLYNSTPTEATFLELKETAGKIAAAVHTNTTKRDVKIFTRMQDYIHKNFSDDIQLLDLAQEFNITPKYCSKVFSRVSNDAFKNYLNSYRIEQAKHILEKTPIIKISDLSIMVGFNSSTSFIRVFNKYTGMPPKAYADRILNKNI